jgi:hypothetical protein
LGVKGRWRFGDIDLTVVGGTQKGEQQKQHLGRSARDNTSLVRSRDMSLGSEFFLNWDFRRSWNKAGASGRRLHLPCAKRQLQVERNTHDRKIGHRLTRLRCVHAASHQDTNHLGDICRTDESTLQHALDGLMTLHDLRTHGVDLVNVDADTIGGAVLERLGRLARPGDEVTFGGYTARVDTVRRRRVARVTIRKRPATDPPQPG